MTNNQIPVNNSSRSFSFQMISLTMVCIPSLINAHGYLKSPRARNFIAYEDGVWSGSSPSTYTKESCPHCLNLGGSMGQCGVMGNIDYTFPRSRAGTVIPADPQIVVQRGSQLSVEVVLTAHHKGHFEFKACPMSEQPDKECFERHPLNLVTDELYGSSPDPSYPTRAYIPSLSYNGIKRDTSALAGTQFRYTLQLPRSLQGGNALLQWHYVTANSCAVPGYRDFNFPSQWNLNYQGLKICDMPLPADGRGLPEQFWNCAEIRVVDQPMPMPTSQGPNPTLLPPTRSPLPPTKSPPPTDTLLPPIPVPTSLPCGDGRLNNGVCANPKLCCSQWGWCDITPAHCNPTRNFRSFNITTELSHDTLMNQESDNEHEMQLAPPRNNGAYSNLLKQVDLSPDENSQSTTQKSCTPSKTMKVNMGYYQSWAIGRPKSCNKVDPSDLEGIENFTHLIYSFASISTDHRLEPWGGNYGEEKILFQKFNALKESNKELKTLIAVGGWYFNEKEGTKYRFSDTAATLESRSTFANSAVDFCREYGFDGVNLDWEYPGDENRGGTTADYGNYVLLVQAIREAFDDVSYVLHLELSMAIPISYFYLEKGYNLIALNSKVDYFNVMSYDLNGSWSSAIATHTNINIIKESFNYFFETGIPSQKLILGLALYGRTYVLDDPLCNYTGCPFKNSGPGGCAGALNYMPYFTIQHDYIEAGNFKSYVSHNLTTGSAVLIVDGDDGDIWIDFDSEETLRLKREFAAEECLGGIMWWALDMLEQAITFNDYDYYEVNAEEFDNINSILSSLLDPSFDDHLNGNYDSNDRFPLNDGNALDWIVSDSPRCGVSEIDARGNCGPKCTSAKDCPKGQWCWVVRDNYCGSKAPKPSTCTSEPQNGFRCGIDEFIARERCGQPCQSDNDCDGKFELCQQLNLNFCYCYDEDEQLKQRRNLRVRVS